jgi:hypothetical protein
MNEQYNRQQLPRAAAIRDSIMTTYKYYEVEGAVFRDGGGEMEVFSDRQQVFSPYTGDVWRVLRLSNPMTLEEVAPFMVPRDRQNCFRLQPK